MHRTSAFSLGVPFTERFFDLAIESPQGEAGYVGMITTNSFMKREFGKKLIQDVLPRFDLTHVIDTSGAYIPGHGTPTVILVGRHRMPRTSTVRAVMGIRGEPETPADASQGKVWRSIVELIDQPGAQNAFVSVADLERETLQKHPWSIGGGGAAELKELIESAATSTLGDISESIGFASFPGQDDVFVLPENAAIRLTGARNFVKPFVYGEALRDWSFQKDLFAFAPYAPSFRLIDLDSSAQWARYLWNYRVCLAGVVTFGGKTRSEVGNDWWGWYRWVEHKYRTPLSIAFAEIATHNHFVLDRGGKVFKQTAPIIKLPPDANEDDHLALLGLLNSSTACFWLKQVCFPKGGNSDTHGWALSAEDPWDRPYAFNSTTLGKFPVPTDKGRPANCARRIVEAVEARAKLSRVWLLCVDGRRLPCSTPIEPLLLLLHMEIPVLFEVA
ncbi:MAG: BREX-2 system adenine-specific DNA-methyltransferase PglX [Candidatus Xenobia bacterium]